MTYARAALAGLVLLAVAGCTGGDPAGGDPSDPPSSASPRATPSPTPTLAPPTIPPEAQEHSAQGAAAFVEYYMSLVNFSIEEERPGALRAASEPGCGGCNGIIRLISKYEDFGGWSENPEYRTRVTASQLIRGTWAVTADVSTSRFRYKEAASTEVRVVEAASFHYLYELAWMGDSWKVSRMAPQKVPGD